MLRQSFFRFIGLSCIWILIWFIVLLVIPVVSYKPNQAFIWTLNLLFILTTMSALFFVFYLLARKNRNLSSKICNRKYIGPRQLKANVILSSIGGVFGFAFIFYDRVFIRGIDYTAGLRAARYQWLRETTGGSLFSVVGNLIVPFGYVSLFLLVVYFYDLSRRLKLALISSALLGVVGHAALNGGRSNLLIAIFVFIAIYIFSAKKDILVRRRKTSGAKTYGYFAIVIVLTFVFYMTVQSATSANISLVELVRLGVASLYGQPTGSFDLIVNEYTALPVYILSYLFHGSWTAEALYSISERPGSYLFYPISVIASSLKIMTYPLEIGYFSESGAFLSLPGAIFYDFGLFGVAVIGLLFGLVLGGVVYILLTKRVTLISFGLCLYPLVIFFMAPILPAYGLIYFNFVVYAFVLFGFLNRILFFNRCYWL